MAHKLVPIEGKPFLEPAEVVSRLRDEFDIVEVDADEGRDHIQAMLLQFIKMKQGGMAGCDEHIEHLQKVEADALMVVIADDRKSEDALLRFAVIPGEPIIIGYFNGRHQELSEPILKRASEVLGYSIKWA
jgi:hypothetical protein